MDSNKEIKNVNVDLIIPNRFQPRLTFDENALNELANSIKEHGIIQPLVLRRVNDKYEIIAGERRYKAAQIAGLTEVPAIITDIDDNKSAEVALVENVQRKNLNSMEEAKSYKKILDRGYLTQEALAQKMGISQSTLANRIRLLNLAPEVQDALTNGKISERHARSLLLVDDKLKQINLLNRVISERLTVRQLDAIIKEEKDKNENNITLDLSNSETETNTSSNEQVLDNNLEIYEEPKDEVAEKGSDIIQMPVDEESLETLDSLDDNVKEPSTLDRFLERIAGPKYTSLEEESANMNVDNEELFNPFNNLNDAEFLPVEKEEKVEEVVKTEEPKSIIKSGNLDSVKEAYRNLAKEVEQSGFKIAVEDFDFEDIYQIIIKIDKQD